jgi:hypothetical protein
VKNDLSMRAAYQPGRRKFLFSAISLAVLAAVDPLSLTRAADSVAGERFVDGDFMTVSRLIAVAPPDPVTGLALCHALQRSRVGFDGRLRMLAQKVRSDPSLTIEALAADLDRRGEKSLRTTLNEIVAAWYLGVVDDHVYAYEGALMFRITEDVLSPPSYVHGGPLNWVDTHPPID